MMSTKRTGALGDAIAGRRAAGRNRALRRTLIGLSLAAVVTTGSVVASSGAQAASAAPIKGAGSGRCVDVPGSATANGTQLELWDCNGGGNQSITQTSSGGLQVLGKCIVTDGGSKTAGAKVVLAACSSSADQAWTVNGSSVMAKSSGLCLDATDKGTANGTLLVVWTCNSGNNQQWSFSGSTGGGSTTPPVTTPPVTTTTPSGGGTGGNNPPTKTISLPNNLGVHDPSRIINDNGSYYFYGTGGGIPGYYTTDGKNWKGLPSVFPNGIPSDVHAGSPTNDGRDVWAPDIIWNPNTSLFSLYYAVADWNNTTRSAIGLATSPTLNPNASNYKWTDRGIVIARSPSATGYQAIDPAPFFDAQGNMWMSLGSGYATTRATAINIVALNKNTGLRSDSQVHSVQGCGCEASYVQYHSGYYYLFWNTGGCCSGSASTYLIHVARSSSVTGPYSGTRNFFASTSTIHGPGQIGFLSQNGKDYYTYHYYPNSGGSVMGIGTVTWGSDGWPSK